MRSVDWLGWVSSGVLVVTTLHQVAKQWREGRSEGVSVWLFVGQFAASAGFLVYSVFLDNWVFTVTNAILIIGAVTGGLITWWHRHNSRRKVQKERRAKLVNVPPYGHLG